VTSRTPIHSGLRILLSLPIFFGAAAAALTLVANADGLPAEEAGRIEALISAVTRMRDAAFIRNGRAYDSATAAEFLRRKWQAQASQIASVENFIERVGSASSTTGQPYLIRFGDGREIPCSVFLRDELLRLQAKKPYPNSPTPHF
jgi:hypothetical protein